MSQKILIFGNIKIEKTKFYCYKSPILKKKKGKIITLNKTTPGSLHLTVQRSILRICLCPRRLDYLQPIYSIILD